MMRSNAGFDRRVDWRRQRPLLVALAILLALVALPARYTRYPQSAWQRCLAPGRSLVFAAASRASAALELCRNLGVTAEASLARNARLRELEAEVRRARSQRDMALVEVANLRDDRSQAEFFDAASHPLLAASLVEARWLGPASQAFLRGHKMLGLGERAGVRPGSLLVEPVLDQGTSTGLAAGRLLVVGRRVWGKVAAAGPWTSQARHVTSSAFRDLVTIVSADDSRSASPRAQGVLYGEDKPLCRLRRVSIDFPVSVGDCVVATLGYELGAGPLYYGHVVRAEQESAATDWEIWVAPAIAGDEALPRVAVVVPQLNPDRLANRARTPESTR